jgi:hypothetical protein
LADRYWVGGAGTWNSSNTTNWSASSGGAGGASVPTAADNVFFDAGSDAGGTFDVFLATSPRVCNDFTASGLDFTMTLTSILATALNVSGSLSFPATNFTLSYPGTTTFNATTTGKTITTNGVAFTADVTFDGIGGAWTLGSAFSCGTSALTLTNGTFNTSVSNYAVTAGEFSSDNSNTRTINLNGSTITLSIGDTGTAWDLETSTNATINAGTSTINLTSVSAFFRGGSLTYHNVSFTSTTSTSSPKFILDANTFNNLTIATNTGGSGLNNIVVAANQTINGTFTISGNSARTRQFIRSNIIGTTRTLTCAAIASVSDVDFRDITIAGAHGTLSGTRLGDCGGNSNITFNAGVNKYWNRAGGGNWSAQAWALSSGGAAAISNFPLAQDTAIIGNAGLNTSATVTINERYNVGTLDTSTRSNPMTLATGGRTISFYGNFTYGSGVTPTGSGYFDFVNRSIKTLNSGGKTFTQAIYISSPGGGIQLVTNNLTTLDGTLENGTVDLNGLTLTSGSFETSPGTKNITFNGGTLSLSDAVWNNANPTNFTTTAGTGTGAISMTSASAKIFIGGGSTYNCNLNQGGAGDLTITGSNTFNDITNSVQPATILFTAGTTQTVSDFTLSGTSGNLITIDSTTASQFTLSKASGTVSVSFVDIADSNATGGATWNAFTSNGCVDSGNNTGWIFAAANIYDVTILESTTAADLISALGLFPTSVVETATASEQVSSLADFASQINEASTASEQTSASASFNSSTQETSTGADQVLSLADFASQISEISTASEQTSATASFNRSAQETSTASEQTSATASLNSNANESATGTDQAFATSSFNRSTQETATAADQVSSLADFSSQTSETSTASEQTSATASLNSNANESATEDSDGC